MSQMVSGRYVNYSNGIYYDAARISSNGTFVEAHNVNSGTWYDVWSSGGRKIVDLSLEGYTVYAHLDNGRKEQACLLSIAY